MTDNEVIKELSRGLKVADKIINEQRVEIERLNGILESYALQYGTVRDKEYFIRRAKIDAVKAVVSRLKDSLEGKTEPIDDYDLDEVEQEMMEEINE